MKLFNFDKRYLYFVLLFFVVLIVDYIFFVGLKIPELFDFGLPAVVALIGFFVIIPVVVAYHLSFKLKKNFSKELEIRKINKKAVIVISVLLALFIFLLIPKGSVKFEPYTFYPVTEDEFKKPLKILIEKKIDENKYYLKETEKNGTSLFQQDGDNSADGKFLFDIPFEAKNIIDFWFDSSTKTTFVIEERYVAIKDRLEQVSKFSLYAQENRIQVLKIFERGIYSGRDRILDYFSDSDNLLLESGGGGDGCSGWGELWLLNQKRSLTLQKYGRDCMSQDIPKFIGYDGKFLYFASFNTDESRYPSDLRIIGLKKIFKINPRTQERITLPISNYPTDATDVYLSEETKELIIRTAKNKNFTLNIDNLLIKEASSSASN